jgi:hypothetical protein
MQIINCSIKQLKKQNITPGLEVEIVLAVREAASGDTALLPDHMGQ